MKNKTNAEILNFVFNRLRLQEGITVHKDLDKMDNSTLFKVLFNTRYKQDANFPLTNLEKTARDHCGKYIWMYVCQKYEEEKKLEPIKNTPYASVAHLTLADINGRDRCA